MNINILMVPSWYPSKDSPLRGIFFKEQAEALARSGANLTVLYFDLSNRSRAKKNIFAFFPCITWRKINAVRTIRIRWIHLFHGHRRKLAIEKYLGLIIIHALKLTGNGPCIIHAHSVQRAGYICRALSEASRIPFVITEHSSAFQRDLVSRKKLSLVKSVFESSCATIAVSPVLKTVLAEQTGFCSKDIIVIPNIVDTDFYRPSPSGTSCFNFVTISFLTMNKGIDILLRAFALALPGLNASRLLVGGDGEARVELELLAMELGIRERVDFLGMLSREGVRDALNASNAYVSSSYHETFGITLIEAMACGIPVIATRSGGPESIVSAEVGVLVPVGDVEALSSALCRVHRGWENYSKERIRGYCIERFSEKAVVGQLEKLYTTYGRASRYST